MKTIAEICAQPSIILNLDHINFTEDTQQFEKLGNFIKTNKHLKGVSFSKTNINIVDFQKAIKLFEAMKAIPIESLIFNSCNMHTITKDNLTKLLQCINVCNIKKIIITRDNLSAPFPAVEFISALCSISLEELNLSMMHLGELQLSDLTKIIQLLGSSKLKSLSLATNLIGQTGFQDADVENNYNSFIKPLLNGTLNDIDLSNNPLGIIPLEWSELFKILHENKSLQSLNLRNCALEFLEEYDENFIALLVDFIKNTKLTRLDLSANTFSKGTQEKLSQTAKENKKLTLVILEGNSSTKEANESIQPSVTTALPAASKVITQTTDVKNQSRPALK